MLRLVLLSALALFACGGSPEQPDEERPMDLSFITDPPLGPSSCPAGQIAEIDLNVPLAEAEWECVPAP